MVWVALQRRLKPRDRFIKLALGAQDAAKIISAIEGDKKIKVTDACEIATRVLGIAMLKGRTRPQYLEAIRSKFIVLDREERKREASEANSKTWGNG